ncbi:gliding motility-associated C-terminal domain-containing protein [Geofilum sp. OHC36d9]|uniref:T9SS type B sorting domain-containing protein n=1 Tax=Geofilum sp. OHC36d9 TaxID=3458413 RepID=UPI00403443DA
MIYKYLRQLFFFLLVSFLTTSGMWAQEREVITKPQKQLPPELKGLHLEGGVAVISSVPDEVCTNGAAVDIYLDPSIIPSSAVRIDWEVYVLDGVGNQEMHSEWIEDIGTEPENGIRFHPEWVSEAYYNSYVIFSYRFWTGMGHTGDTNFDYTLLSESPSVYNFAASDGTDYIEACDESVVLVLDGSEVGVSYDLFKDGVSVLPIKRSGSGSSVSFIVDQSGIYTVVAYRNSSVCTELMSGEVEVAVFDLPTPSIDPVSPLCEGETLSLRGNPDGLVSYTWTGPGITGSLSGQDQDLINVLKTTHEGTYSLLVQDSNGCENTATVDVVVNVAPEVSITNPGPFCEGDAAILTANVTGGQTPYSYQWYEEGSALPAETNSTILIDPVSLSDNGVEYSIVVSDDNSCSSAEVATNLTVNEVPVITPVALSGILCEGNTLTFSTTASGGSGTYTYNWTLDGVTLPETSDELSLILSAGSYTVAVSATSGGCVSPVETYAVTVLANPVADLTGDADVCLGSTASYDATGTTGATSYQFFLDGTSVQGPSAIATYSYTPVAADAGAHTLRVVTSNANGCTDEASLNFDVYPNPVVSMTLDDTEICTGESTSLNFSLTTGQAPWSLIYNDGSGDITVSSISSSTHSISVNPSATTTYTLVSVTDAGGCNITPATTVNLVVNPIPVLADLTGDSEVCLGEPFSISASASGATAPYSYNWEQDGAALTFSGSVYSQTNAALSHAGTYTVVAVDDKGCMSTSKSHTLTVNEATATLSANPGDQICAGTSVTFTAGGAGTGTYEFFVDGTSVQGPSATATYTSAALTDGQVVSVNIVDGSGCADAESITMTVYPLPVAAISFSDTEICSGESTTLSISLTTGVAPWSVTYNDGVNDVTETNIATSVFTTSIIPTADVTYTLLSVTDANGCSAVPTGTASVTVNSNPTVSLPANDAICLGEDYTITATPGGGSGNYVNYTWTKDGTVLSSVTGASVSIIGAKASDAGTYEVTVTDDNGCISGVDNFVLVVNEATATLSATSTEICEGESITFTAGGAGTGTYEFFVEGTSVQAPSTTNTYSSSVLTDGQSVSVKIVDVNGCEDSESLTITVNEKPDFSITADVNDVCAGTSIKVSAPTGYDSYIFYVNGVEIHSGAANTYSSSSFNNNDVVSAEATLGGCSSTANNSVTLQIKDLPVITLSSDKSDDTACLGDAITFTASGGDVYQFFVDGTGVTATTPNTYISSSLTDGQEIVVVGTGTNGCSNSDTVVVTINEPVAKLEVDDTNVCLGSTAILKASGGDSYEFFDASDASLQGPDANNELSIDVNSLTATYSYYVTVTDAYGCTDTSDPVKLTAVPLPVASLTASETEICEDNPVTFTASGGTNYAFYLNGVSVQSGTSNTFTYSSLSSTDEIYATVTDASTCESLPSDTLIVSVHPKPIVELTASSLNVTEGEPINFTATGGDEYQFYLNSVLAVDWSGTNTWTLNAPQDGDIITVLGRSGYGCIGSDADTLSVDAYPVVFDLLPDSVTYCGFDGAQLYLSGYETDVTYALYEVSGATPVFYENGTEGNNGVMTTILWNNVPEGQYTVLATRNGGTSPFVQYEDTTVVIALPSPAQFDMSPGGTFTSCETDRDITLSGSEVDIEYYLLHNGSRMSIYPIIGDGNALDFGSINVDGTYQIEAYDTESGCSSIMNGSLVLDYVDGTRFNLISVPSVPVYCGSDDDAGVNLLLDGSETGVIYRLWKNGTELNNANAGTGDTLDFNIQKAGVYRIEAEVTGECSFFMNNSITITEDPGVNIVNLVAENDGLYCEGDAGVEISLASREDGVTYELYYSSVESANLLKIMVPTDLNSFGTFDLPGNYILQGYFEGGCDAVPLDTVTVGHATKPQVYGLSVDGNLCDGTGSAVLSLENSETNVDYQLYYDDGTGFTYTGKQVNGAGGPLYISVSDAGLYYIMGAFNDGTSACTSIMPDTVEVKSVAYPERRELTIKDGEDCSTGAEISIVSPEADVTYELFRYDPTLNDIIATGNVADASGSFEPVVDGDGYYHIYASHFGCGKFLEYGGDSIHVQISGVPVAYSAYGEDAVCEGDGSTSVMLSGSETGVTYYLYRYDTDSTASVIDSIEGSDMVDFEVYSEGVYYIEADMSGCVVPMTGEVEVTFNPLPVAFKMTGSGIYCGADAGAVLGLEGSETDVLYTLVGFDGVVYDSDVPGTGSEITFAAQNIEGQYRVFAKNQVTGCTSSMNDSVKVQYMTVPDTLSATVTLSSSDGLYCNNEPGITVTVSNVQNGVTYSLLDLTSGETTNSVIATIDGGTVELLASDLSTDGSGTDLRILASYEDGSCGGALDTINVTSEDAPDAPVIVLPTGNSLSVCSYDAYIKVYPFDTDVDYTIFSDVALDVFDDPTVVNDTLVWDLTDGITGSFIYVEASIDGHCPVSSRFISVNILEGIDPFVLKADNGLYCEGTDGLIIEVDTTTAGFYYELYQDGVDDVPVDIIKGNGMAKSFMPVTGSSTGVDYYVKVDATTVCSSIDPVTITVTEVPVPVYQTLNDSILTGSRTMLWLSDSEEPNTFLPSIWKDTVFYQSYVDDIPDIEYEYGYYIEGDGNSISLDTLVVSGNAIYFAKRNVYDALGDSILGCWADFDDVPPLVIGSNKINAEDFYLFVPVDKNTVGVNLSDYVTPDYIPKDELDFKLLVGDVEGDDGLFWMWKNEETASGTEVDSLNLMDFESNILASLKLLDTNQDSCVFARNSSVLYGVINVNYTVSHDDYGSDGGTITIVIGNAVGVDGTTFILPNAFSPNGDGVNDVFKIEGLDKEFSDASQDPETQLTVFNRWGTIVYQSEGLRYGNGGSWWNGTSNYSNMVSIGDDLPNGTYFYVLKVKLFIGEKIVNKDFAGFVELRR